MFELFGHEAFANHERVAFVHDPACGLHGIIGIHDTTLGPAAGGCRMHPYESVNEALTDVLRLSEGMTLKNAAAGLPLGGGKCVVIGDPAGADKEVLLRSMARHVQRLGGHFWTAIDVGVSAEDADVMAEECDYIFATATEFQEDDPPSYYTSLGGFHGVRAVAAHLRGTDDLRGLRVAVQGVGQTGARLISLLVNAGAEVIAADTREAAIRRVIDEFDVERCDPQTIHAEAVDVFAPCAMGGVLNDASIPELNRGGIAGLANNQLSHPEHSRQLLERGIAYAPDFLVNSGGVIRATMPIYSEPNRDEARSRISELFTRLRTVLADSEEHRIPTDEIARRIARDQIRAAQIQET